MNAKITVNPCELLPLSNAYAYNSLHTCTLIQSFRSILDSIDEGEEPDAEFDWRLCDNYVILPISCLSASGNSIYGSTASEHLFEYEILHKFDFDIMSLIEEKAKLPSVLQKAKKKDKLKTAIWMCVSEPNDEDYLHNLLDFK